MIAKIICLAVCAVLLFISYKARFFAEKILRKPEPSESLLLKIKTVALACSAALFIIVLIFIK